MIMKTEDFKRMSENILKDKKEQPGPEKTER